MNRNEMFNKLKMEFKKLMFASNSTTLETQDGKSIIVLAEDIAVGVEVYLLDSDNTQKPLDNGDYKLTDGRTISVADNKVTNISAPEGEKAPKTDGSTDKGAAPVADTKMADGMPDGQTNSDGANADDVAADGEMEARVSALEEQMTKLMTMLEGSMASQTKMYALNTELSKKIKVLEKQPDGQPIKLGKKMISDKSSDDIEEIREMINKKRNSFFK